MDFQYIFDCPVHGLEQQVFCWRAFQKENDAFWKKCMLIETEFEIDEKDKLLSQLALETKGAKTHV